MPRGVSYAPATRLLGAALLLAGCGGDPKGPTMEICTELQASSILRTQCGPTEDFTPINSYRGAIADAQIREDAVALIAGNCTGTLIAAAAGPVVLTAGHCVGLGDTDLIAFNYEDQPDGDQLATNGTV